MPQRTNHPNLACSRLQSKLGAYLDGELDRRAQNEIEAHLAACADCRAELEALRRLSVMLRAAPLPRFTPPLEFKNQLMLQLPRQPQSHSSRPNPGAAGWLLPWLAPALVLAAWIFTQVTLGLATVVSLAGQAGLLGTAAFGAADPRQALWFATAQAALGGMLSPQGQNTLTLLHGAGLFSRDLIGALLLQVGMALLYWVVLILAWRGKRIAGRVSPAPVETGP